MISIEMRKGQAAHTRIPSVRQLANRILLIKMHLASSFSAQALGHNPGVYVAKFKYQFNGEAGEQETLQSIQVFCS